MQTIFERFFEKIAKNEKTLSDSPKAFYTCFKSAFADSANRATVCAGTAADAGISIDHELTVTFADGTDGTSIRTSAARNAIRTDFVCHSVHLLFISTLILVKSKK